MGFTMILGALSENLTFGIFMTLQRDRVSFKQGR